MSQKNAEMKNVVFSNNRDRFTPSFVAVLPSGLGTCFAVCRSQLSATKERIFFLFGRHHYFSDSATFLAGL